MTSTDIESSQVPSRLTTRDLLVIASPIIVVILGSLAARVMIQLFGQWAWAGTFPIYWGSMALIVALLSGWKKALSWYGRPSGSVIWLVLALLVGLAPFPMLLLPNLGALRPLLLVICWFVFALINGNVEEVYWRGFLFNELHGWPKGWTVTYSTILFIAVHFLMMGQFSAALFNLPFFVILTVLSLVLVLLYLRTGSLRWSVLCHILADWGNMNIFVFMGLVGLI